MNELTQDRIRELFDYRDGNLYWKVARSNIKAGDRAGYVREDDYQAIRIDGKLYLAHRLIFLYHHGYLPEFLDHIDRNPSNNSIDNLREATLAQNNTNVEKQKSYSGKSTTSTYKGVSWFKRDKRWKAQIRINTKLKHLGYFTSEIDAAKSYNKAAIEAFGEFSKLNNIE